MYRSLLLLLLSLTAFAWAQERPECLCGAFISMPNGEQEIHRLPPIDLDDCEQETACSEACSAEWVRLTNGGDLDYMMENGVTVGQEACSTLAAGHGHENLPPHYVYAYYNLCNGPWMWDGETSQQKLCCHEGEYPGNCEEHTPRPPTN